MGRTLKRVPLDFAHPWEGKESAWPGYRNPHYRECPSCKNGQTPDLAWLEHFTHLLLMAGESHTSPRLHPWLQAIEYAPDARPTAAMAELTGGLAGRPPCGPFGHDASDRRGATKAIINAAGLPEDWGTCSVCKGEGQDPAFDEAYKAWEPYDPPKGEGYQMWEDTSEGSPNSPVFTSLDALCEWLAPNASWFGSSHATKEQWLAALGGDGVSGLMVTAVGSGVFTVDGLVLDTSSDKENSNV